MERPNAPAPQWCWAAPAGRTVEPDPAKAAVGYLPNEAPPANWLNYHLSLLGQWQGFLAGPSTVAWAPRVYNDPSTGVVRLAVDTVTADAPAAAPEARYRYAVAAVDGTGPMVLVSRRGHAWVTRRNLPGGAATPGGVLCAHVWYLWTAAALYETPLDADGASSALRSGGTAWLTSALPASPGAIADMATADSGAGYVVASTSTAILYCAFGVGAWAKVTPAGREAGRAVCWTGQRYVEVSSNAGNGVVSYAANPSGAWTLAAPLLTGVTADVTWRLAVGEVDGALGTVVAFKTGTAAPQVFRSLDHGATWSSVATPTGLRQLTAMRWHDGVWVATSTVAPYAWSSSDLEHWTPLPVLVGESGAALYDVAFADGAWLLVGREGALHGAPAVDAAPGGYTPGTRATTLSNAGYLRGVKISVTAPTNGQVPTYDAGLNQWVPTTPSGGGAFAVSTRTSSYTASAGDVVLCNAAAVGFSVSLPPASAAPNASITVKKIDATTNAVTIAPDGSETIDDAATLDLTTQYTAVTLWSDGSNWWVT